MIDYHIHTHLCRHAEGGPGEYADAAVKMGLREIGFADHFPLEVMGVTPKTQVTMVEEELELYFQMVKQCGQSGDISVKTGIELDYVPLKTAAISDRLKEYPFDYIIGSIHFMDDWDFTHPYYAEEFETKNLEEINERYYALVIEACRSGLFDIIGHIDVIKKFNYRPKTSFLKPFYEEVARVLKETGVCLEVNTSGLDAPVNEIYPDVELLRLCVQKGVKVVLGSDAHSPGQVGRYFPRAVEMLGELGVRETVSFDARQGRLIPLEG
jgi:histidinol-phosphatase (PHP family)